MAKGKREGQNLLGGAPKREARWFRCTQSSVGFPLAETETESRPPLGGSFARGKEGGTPFIGD